MKLVPDVPTGCSRYKARPYALAMRELREQGYTFEDIRRALAKVGIEVSNATVQREVARAYATKSKAAPAGQVSRQGPPVAVPPILAPPAADADKHLSSREVAQKFFDQQITNPLILAMQSAKETK